MIALYKTSVYFSTDESCMMCHVHPHVENSWKLSKHVNNGSGVKTHCVACHLPPQTNTWKHYSAKAKLGMKDVWSTGRKAQLLLGLQLGDRMRLAARERLGAPLPCRRRLRRGLLHDGIPCAAGRAAPRPLCGLVAALGAVKYGFCLHGVSPFLFLMLPLAHRRVPRESRRRRSQPACADSPSRRALRPPPRWRESRTRPAPRDSGCFSSDKRFCQ